MTGGSVAHARVVRRLVGALAAGLRPGCEAFGGNLKVLTAGRARYPDAMVVCEPRGPRRRNAVEPTVVLEGAVALDGADGSPGQGSRVYAAVASVLAYIILEQDEPRATVLRRSEEWREAVLVGPDTELPLPEVGAVLRLGTLYG